MAERPLDWDIVLLYAPPWLGPTRFSKHHLASYLARRGARVMYVEAPLTPLGLSRGRGFINELKQTVQAPRRAAERLWVRRYFLPLPFHAVTSVTNSRAANKVGQRLLAPAIRNDIKRLRLKEPIVIAGLPHAADVLPLLRARGMIYHCADDYAHVRGFPSTLGRVEAQLCRQADLVITTSETLCQTRQQFNPNTYWIPNGVDIQHFAQAITPAPELQQEGRPIVGFVGGLSEWVDLELVGRIARCRPAYTFVLVGPIAIDTTPIAGLPNVKLLGPRPYAAVPAYLAAMDVALIPFKRNEVTYHADPIKVYEYLAAGLPVVATELPSLQRLSNLVRLAADGGRFIEAIDAAVQEGRETRRVERQHEARNHSWDQRFSQLERLIGEHVACAS